MATGKIPIPRLNDGRLNVENVGLFFESLIFSLRENPELTELLDNITGGNVRGAIDLIKVFIGSPNVNVRKILEVMHITHEYLVAVHEFAKSVILGDYAHYVSDASTETLNGFDVGSADPREHFLVPMILGYLNSEGTHRNRDGFVQAEDIIEEMQKLSFRPQQTEESLRRTANKKLLETTARVTFEEDTTGLIGEMPPAFRITTGGAYHVSRWLGSFVYLDAMSFDTPIFNHGVLESMKRELNTRLIDDRYMRFVTFRNYLSQVWREANLAPAYFDWEKAVRDGQHSFVRVERYIARRDAASGA